MNRSFFTFTIIAVLAAFLVTNPNIHWLKNESARDSEVAAAASTGENELVPVEPDMHDFMEDYFQPTFRRIQKLMRKEPENIRDWKAIRSDAIILAESGNLLIGRHEEDAADWDKFSVDVRDFGKKMYAASKEKQFDTAKQEFTAMIDNCNACHKQFADGKHQLKVQ